MCTFTYTCLGPHHIHRSHYITLDQLLSVYNLSAKDAASSHSPLKLTEVNKVAANCTC